MKISIFTVSSAGCRAAKKIYEAVNSDNDAYGMMTFPGGQSPGRGSEGIIVEVYIKSKYADEVSGAFVIPEGEGLNRYVGDAFRGSDALIFVCAAGIAVRLIAPYIKHKSIDPAVLVIDERMDHCIPVLSGHLGGANRLAMVLSAKLMMTPVITTASDIRGRIAVDMFARANGLVIKDFDMTKAHTAASLEGETLYVLNDAKDVFDTADLPEGYEWAGHDIGDKEHLIRITYSDDGSDEFVLIPRCVCVGVGCRKGTSCDKIKEAVMKCLESHGIYREAVKGIFSIDLKKDEEGIREFCSGMGVPFVTYSSEELNSLEGDFTSSGFVEEITGTDNVCERSAMMCGSRLLVRKETYDGVTVAVSV